ncbi:MAG TPA: hypothetical protein VK753_04390, partial [Xanthomonadaceae bacterium]|nr:hypothetical protein [Xanthomonadaceae bacterium]
MSRVETATDRERRWRMWAGVSDEGDDDRFDRPGRNKFNRSRGADDPTQCSHHSLKKGGVPKPSASSRAATA